MFLDEPEAGECFFCTAQCDGDYFCYGCEEFVCNVCDEVECIGRHMVEEHRRESDGF